MEWRQKVDRASGGLLGALLPPRCLLCGADGVHGRDLCAGCLADLPVNTCCCARCALPLEHPAARCGICLKREPPFTAAWAPFRYAHPLDLLEARFKFHRDLAAGRLLANLMIEAAKEQLSGPMPGLLLCVPVHRDRLRERGYNQALELARPLAKALDIPLDADALIRLRHTSAQTGLDAKARRRNLHEAFAVRTDTQLPAHIAILDDVMTTGTTLRECARVLLRTGVERIDVWALARAPARGSQ
ncbi:MAG: ComF family protein [Dokdonella sp.]|uniref:ComF family protein n=1 Tax=Dokdonella sp. TaxID=2291710 RepID=UPI003BAF5DAE